MISFLYNLYRWSTILTLLAIFFVVGTLAKLVLNSEFEKRRFATTFSSWCARLALRLFGVDLIVSGTADLKGRLIVCNHVSYFDAIVLNAFTPCVFVTSKEVQETAVLGFMASLGGCLFIERRHREQVDQDVKALGRALREGFTVVLFPEGTSTNGEYVLPFKKTLFDAAIENEVSVIPVTLNYRAVNHRRFTQSSRDKICYYGDMQFFTHFKTLIENVKQIGVCLKLLTPIPTSQLSCRRDVANRAYKEIVAHYEPLLAPREFLANPLKSRPLLAIRN